jgi:octaprenyl-diphosphate synthase
MTQSLPILGIISRLALNLAEGELSQLASANGSILDEEHYFEIIRKKTAVLISSCTEIGALSVGASKQTIEKFRLFGEYLGICFQIKDDIFDYFEQGEIGKPTGNDIREGKVTLPLLHALKNGNQEESDKMLQIIKNKDFTAENIDTLISFAKENNGIQYAYSKMDEIKEKAVSILAEYPDSEAKKSLLDLVDYVIERKK